MAIGIVGHKRGMTRIFTDQGQSIPVTVIQASTNRVVRLLEGRKGCHSVQLSWGKKRRGNVSKAWAGMFAKLDLDAGEGLIEFPVNAHEAEEMTTGSEIGVDIFEVGQWVDVSGITLGKGFSGVIKRHNFKHQRYSHGNSVSHRAPGSIGQCQTPGRVFKGKKMAGQMGNVQRTVQNLKVIRVDSDRHLLLVKGAVPGTKGGKIVVKPSVKGKGNIREN